MGFALDDSSYATLPARFRASPSKVVAYFGRSALHRMALAACTRLPDALLARWRSFAWVPWLGYGAWRWVHTREMLEQGLLTPVVVVDPAQGLCAAYTSLTRWGDQHAPVVKVFEEQLALGALQGAAAGTRLAAASAFWHPADPWTPEWRDFQPRVLACLSDDAQACEAALARLAPELWDDLEEAVASLGERRYFPGLHRLDPARFRAFV